MKLLHKFLFILSLAFLVSCEREITIDLDEEDPRVVIEGWVHSDPGPYEVLISKTNSVFSTDEPLGVSGALVIISDDLGARDTLVEMSPGVYHTTTLQGAAGRIYTLNATVEGELFTASSILPRYNPIDTTVIIEEDSSYIFGPGFYPVSVAQEPAGVGDFYLFRFAKNDSLYDDAGDYFLGDDRFVDGNLAIFHWPYEVESGDTAQMEIRSITQEAYDYYFTFLQSQFGGGGPFGAPPDNLLGNISNGGLGYFGAYGASRDTVIVP